MKIKISWIQFFLYGGVGFISCCTDLIIFYLFSQVFFFQLVLSNAISFLLATTFNYILCFSFVFSRNSIPHSQELLRLLFVVLSGLVCNTLCFWALIVWTPLNPFIAKIVAIPANFIWNFWGRRNLVFSPNLPTFSKKILEKIFTYMRLSLEE